MDYDNKKECIPDTESQLLKRQLHLGTGAYSLELRSFALPRNFYSPAAYNYVRQTFKDALPHPSTLRKWYSSVDAKPGFTSESLKAVEIKVKEMKSKGKKLICALMMDKMHIKENVVFKEKANLVNACLDHLCDSEVIVKTLTFNGTVSNFSMAKCLRADFTLTNLKPFFKRPGSETIVHIILDPAHMLKLCRYTLGDWKTIFDENLIPIKWKYFEQ
ncbi:hypothetical protein AGLY_012346 [Aphis glycines]|uniref:THAP domain-containing protein 9 n=1 Tax=Aphis glycines TaxID=307491 RepID=A0A6G0TB51_APHGL|nr:hypothetical protein AGLY_012346 [Aphis glycines]